VTSRDPEALEVDRLRGQRILADDRSERRLSGRGRGEIGRDRRLAEA
jgi:hypothetical protein